MPWIRNDAQAVAKAPVYLRRHVPFGMEVGASAAGIDAALGADSSTLGGRDKCGSACVSHASPSKMSGSYLGI